MVEEDAICKYLETANGDVVVNEIVTYPCIVKCEVIDWISENDYINRKEINNFYSEEVILNNSVPNIRSYIHEILLEKYPTLEI
jgi:hypothetical protein